MPFLTRGINHSLIFSDRHGAIAPSKTDRLLSGITKSGSMPKTEPNPSQRLQAPYGLLKVKRLTDGDSKRIPSNSNLSEKVLILFPDSNNIFISQTPSPSIKPVCIESERRN